MAKRYLGGGISEPALRNDFFNVVNIRQIVLIVKPFFCIFQKHCNDKPASWGCLCQNECNYRECTYQRYTALQDPLHIVTSLLSTVLLKRFHPKNTSYLFLLLPTNCHNYPVDYSGGSGKKR